MKKQFVYSPVKSIYPRFFWRYCIKCDLYFKKEEGWKMTFSLPIPVPNNTTWYVCKECAPIKDDVRRIVNKRVEKLYGR